MKLLLYQIQLYFVTIYLEHSVQRRIVYASIHCCAMSAVEFNKCCLICGSNKTSQRYIILDKNGLMGSGYNYFTQYCNIHLAIIPENCQTFICKSCHGTLKKYFALMDKKKTIESELNKNKESIQMKQMVNINRMVETATKDTIREFTPQKKRQNLRGYQVEKIRTICPAIIREEMRKLVKVKIFSDRTINGMLNFNSKSAIQSCKQTAPFLWSLLSSAVTPTKSKYLNTRMLMCLSTLMYTKSQKVNTLPTITGILLHQSMAQAEGFKILNKFDTCSSYDTVMRTLKEAAKETNKTVTSWKELLEEHMRVNIILYR